MAIQQSSVTTVFADIPEGEYSISVFHDENKNGEIDKNSFGIPKESYGFSNNIMGMFGPPSFEEAKFKVSKEGVVHLKIKLR